MSRLVTAGLVVSALLLTSGNAWPEWGSCTDDAPVALERGGDDDGLIALKRGGDDESLIALKRGGDDDGLIALKRGGDDDLIYA